MTGPTSKLTTPSAADFLEPLPLEDYTHLRKNQTDILNLLFPKYSDSNSSYGFFSPEPPEVRSDDRFNPFLLSKSEQAPMDFNTDFVSSSTVDPALLSFLKMEDSKPRPIELLPKRTVIDLTHSTHSFSLPPPHSGSPHARMLKHISASSSSSSSTTSPATILGFMQTMAPLQETIPAPSNKRGKRKSDEELPNITKKLQLEPDAEPLHSKEIALPKCLFGVKAGTILRYIDVAIQNRWKKEFNNKFCNTDDLYRDYEAFMNTKSISSYVAKQPLFTTILHVALSNIQTLQDPPLAIYRMPSKVDCRTHFDQFKRAIEEEADPKRSSLGRFLNSTLRANKDIWKFNQTMMLNSLYAEYTIWIERESIYHILEKGDFSDSLFKWLPCLKPSGSGILAIPSYEVCQESFSQVKAAREAAKIFKDKVSKST